MNNPPMPRTATSLESEYPGLCDDLLRDVTSRMDRPKYPGAQPALTTTLMILPNYNLQERQAEALDAIRVELMQHNRLMRELTDAVRALARA